VDTLALGEDTGRALGARPGVTRGIGALAVLLLCGAATAGAGPIAFLGLAVPHMVRSVTGPGHRWLLAYSMVWAPVLLLGADVLGRVIARPEEVPVGIVMAFVGAPVFIALLRRRTVADR
jgi:iron complex transport system permease protein